MLKNKINIKIITTEPFPKGMAATNRILSYTKGLVELKQNVQVLSFNPSIGGNVSYKGTYNSVKYFITTKLTKTPKSKFVLPYYFLLSLVYSFKILLRSRSKKANNILLLVSNKPIMMFSYFLYSKLLNYTYLQEKSEFPFVLKRKSVLGKLYARIYTNYFYRLFDGIIVMTKALHKYFTKKANKKAVLLQLPMTVETNRFNEAKKVFQFDYIAYCGYMGNNKDGVSILIESFGIIANKYPDIKLVLIGDGPKDEINKFKKMVRNSALSDRVVFTGQVSREDMPKYLCNAKVLALARPSGMQSTGGFPTKLGEYLSTGNPVVVTEVGEISNYLENEKSAYLSQPDCAVSFSQSLEKALSNYEKAKRIGAEGKKVALEFFEYKKQSEKFLKYLIDLK